MSKKVKLLKKQLKECAEGHNNFMTTFWEIAAREKVMIAELWRVSPEFMEAHYPDTKPHTFQGLDHLIQNGYAPHG